MFSNLKGAKPHLNGLVSNTIGQWSEVNLGNASWRLYGKFCNQSFENMNLSSLLQIGDSCKLD